MLYELSRSIILPGSATVHRPGDIVEIDDAEASRLMTYEPGLLKEVRVTTEAHVAEIRSETPIELVITEDHTDDKVI